MSIDKEKLIEYLAVQANPGLAVFRTLQELRATAKDIAETVVESHLDEIRKELKQMFERELELASREIEKRADLFRDISSVAVQGLRGERGERGETVIGPQGEAGKTPLAGEDYFTPNEVSEFRRAVTPQKGFDYTDGEDGKDGDPGKDGSPDTAAEIRDKLQSLKGFTRLDASAIKNLPQELTRNERTMLHRGGVGFRTERITGQITGNTRVFTVPSHITEGNGMLLVGTQFPFIFFPTTHFTTSGLTLTLTSAVDTPQRGTELLFVYSP